MTYSKCALPTAAILALALAACASEDEDKTYEADVEDVGGGELQVADPKPGEIEVDLPETPMKNVPDETQDEAEERAD